MPFSISSSSGFLMDWLLSSLVQRKNTLVEFRDFEVGRWRTSAVLRKWTAADAEIWIFGGFPHSVMGFI